MSPPTNALAGRYRYERALLTHAGAPRWLAIDTKTNAEVVAVVVDVSQAAALERSVGVTHVHLASVLEVISKPEPDALPGEAPPNTAVAIVESVPGYTLNRALEKGKIQPFKAVVWFTRLVDALEALHGHGGLHDAISPRSVVIEPSGKPIAPVLSQLVAPAIGAYCSPERLRGGYPTPADDVWSLHASLYAAITGAPPYLAGTRADLLSRIGDGKPAPLIELGVDEPDLQRLLEAGLDPDRRTRVSDLGDLKKALDAFDRGAPLPEKYRMPAVPRVRLDSHPGEQSAEIADESIVFDEASLPSDPLATEPTQASPPPPKAPPAPGPPTPVQAAPAPTLPAPLPAASRSTAAAKPDRRTAITGAVVLAVAVSGAGVWWLSSAGSAPDKPASSTASAVPAEASEAPKAPRAIPRNLPHDGRDACIASYFAKNTFDENTRFGFVCEGAALIDVSRELYTLVRSHDPLPEAGTPGSSTDTGAFVIRGEREAKNPPLGWYELAATAIVRQSCCKGATPITVPRTEGWCPQLDDRIRVLAEQSTTPGDLSPYAKKFDEAISCLFATHTKNPYPWTSLPSDAERASFQQFLAHAAVTDAKRSSLMRR